MWHGLAIEEHQQQQKQRGEQEQQQKHQGAQEHGSPHGIAKQEQKWWHVPDGSIEEMIRKLNGPDENMTTGKKSALCRTRSVGTPFNRSVQFGKGMAEEEDVPAKLMDQSAEELPKKKKGSVEGPRRTASGMGAEDTDGFGIGQLG